MKLLTIGESAILLGVSITTLRRWDKSDYLKPQYRTKGNHRRYDLKSIRYLIETNKDEEDRKYDEDRKNVLYARVSSKNQEQSLEYLRTSLLGVQDKEYHLPINAAVKTGNIEIVKSIVEHPFFEPRCNINMYNNFALKKAIMNKHKDVIELLKNNLLMKDL